MLLLLPQRPMSWLLGQERERTPGTHTEREVPTYFGELEEHDLVIERCETVLSIGTYEAECANEDPGGRDEWDT